MTTYDAEQEHFAVVADAVWALMPGDHRKDFRCDNYCRPLLLMWKSTRLVTDLQFAKCTKLFKTLNRFQRKVATQSDQDVDVLFYIAFGIYHFNNKRKRQVVSFKSQNIPSI